MHDRTRDSLARTLEQEATRRGVIGILGGIVAAGVEEGAARQRHHRKQHDRKQGRRKARHEHIPRPDRAVSDIDKETGQCEKPVCLLGTWGNTGTGDGQFRTPRGGGVAPDGTVYIADLNNQRIQYFSATGDYKGQWGTPAGEPVGTWGSGDGAFHNPNDVAVAADGTVYVADYLNQRIQYFSATGDYKGQWGNPDPLPSDLPGQFNEPRFVAVGPDDTVYVSDNLNHRVQYFTPAGEYLGQWGSPGTGPGQFNLPRGITVAPDGNVYVVDLNNFRIQCFNAGGKFLRTWGSQGSGDGQLQQPRFAAVGLDDTVLVSDANLNRIQRFTAVGKLLGQWGKPGAEPGQFSSPHGVEVSRTGIIYVVDSGNNRVQYYRLA